MPSLQDTASTIQRGALAEKLKEAPAQQVKATLTGLDLERVRVFLLDGVGEVEARITAVVSLGILQHNVGEV